jgi:hypothetical protein
MNAVALSPGGGDVKPRGAMGRIEEWDVEQVKSSSSDGSE